MKRNAQGFTLIELMIVVVIIGVLAAIAIPNFVAMQSRAKEGSTKANMHTFQMTAEDYGVQWDGFYASTATIVAGLLPPGLRFQNPFDHSQGDGNSWEDRSLISAAPTSKPGLTSYSDSSGVYNIKGYGRSGAMTLVLSSGQ